MFKPLSALLLAALLCVPGLPLSARASVTLLIPSRPDLEQTPQPADEKQDKKTGDNAANKAETARAAAAAPAAKDSASAPQRQASAPETAPAGKDAPAEATASPAAADGKPAAAAAPGNDGDGTGQETARPVPDIGQEVDVLITRMDPFRHQAEEMSMPQLFAVLRFDEHTLPKDGAMQPERADVLGDVEEAQYLDKKAWGANVALDKPGLYQFIIETRPWWNEAEQRYDQHYVKSFLPVYGVESGWEHPAGLPVEIVPLSRPFGLSNPCLFSGRVLAHGKPRAGALVRAQRINLEKCVVPSRWHEDTTVRTNDRGEFSLILNRPGWWCCTAIVEGTPLKGHDGDPRPLQIGSIVWVYVDAADGQRPAQTQPAKKKK